MEADVAALNHELNQGLYVEETYLTFCEFANQWLPIYIEAKDVKFGTIRVLLHEINKLMPCFAYLKLKDITLTKYHNLEWQDC